MSAEADEHVYEQGSEQEKELRHPVCPAPVVRPLALLVDADNTSVDVFPHIMQHIETWGVPTIRRVYGNQECLMSHKWKDVCLQYALQPVPHIGISGAKNATDIALTVDAMDILWLYAERTPSFFLVTGDQDFTALVLRLRSQGCKVYGIGKPAKAEALMKVCTHFLSIEQLISPVTNPPQSDSVGQKRVPASTPTSGPKVERPQKDAQTTHKKLQEPKVPKKVKQLLTQAAATIGEKKHLKWIPVPHLGTILKHLDGQFQAKNYGYKSLPELIKSQTDLFECRPQGTHLEVRLRKKHNKGKKKEP